LPSISISSVLCVAPPEIIAEKTWIHASEGCDIQLVCTLHGDINSEVKENLIYE
jgi:mediator of RNA polymerase II transcription subunit 1